MATVLVVDDRATNRELARMTLDGAGHEVVEAAGGEHALDLARRLHPDVVLADVVMPGMDGYEFVRHLRTDSGTAGIPVLLYSANYRPDEAEPLARAYGVTRVVSKSAGPPELLAAVDEALRAGPRGTPEAPAAVATEHLRAVNAKLVEKVLALDEVEARFTALAEVSPVGIAIGDGDLRATYVNPSLVTITGMPATALLGTGWRCCVPAGPRADSGTIETGPTETSPAATGPTETSPAETGAETATYHGELDLGGRRRWLNVVVRRLPGGDHGDGFVAMVDDITPVVEAEQRRHAAERAVQAESQRQMQQRFASLARMSGAVAHDLNNLLNVILSFNDFAREAVADASGAHLTEEDAQRIVADLQRVNQAGRRAEHLGRQLLAVGGREIVQPAVLSLNDIVRDSTDPLAAEFGERVRIVTHLDPGLRNTYADPTQLRQVLHNLAVNAAEAMAGSGKLTLTTANQGEQVRLTVADEGTGMTPEVADRAVEPFFTTKPKGPSAGLGLATAYGLIGQAGGTLTIDSSPGRGTQVHILLRATGAAGRTGASGAAGAGRRTILLAEDEEGLREIAVRILGRAGYEVLAAADGEAALALAAAHEGPIDGLLTDVVMPRVNGPQLAEELRRSRPGVPVLFMSGYAAPLMTEEGILPPGVTVVSKPFTRERLLEAVANTLGVPTGP